MILKIGGKPYELATKEEVMKEVSKQMEETKKEVFGKLYPVGSVYISLDGSFNPNKSWVGTTWEKISSGKYIRATNTEADVGKDVAAGLPDITGQFTAAFIQSVNGAFTRALALHDWIRTNNITYNQVDVVGFKASASNSIYGKSNTVTPESIDAFIWKRVG